MGADRETMHIPAIIASGQSNMPSGAATLLQAMRCHVLAKPFDDQELLRAVAAALGPASVRANWGAPVHIPSHTDPSVSEMPGGSLAAVADEAV